MFRVYRRSPVFQLTALTSVFTQCHRFCRRSIPLASYVGGSHRILQTRGNSTRPAAQNPELTSRYHLIHINDDKRALRCYTRPIIHLAPLLPLLCLRHVPMMSRRICNKNYGNHSRSIMTPLDMARVPHQGCKNLP